MRPGDAVWASFHYHQSSPFDEFGGPLSRRRNRYDAIIVTVNHERGHIHAGQILAEVFVPGWNAGHTSRRRGAGSEVPTGLHDLLADALSEEQIGVEEIFEELCEKCVAVHGHGFLNTLEHTGIHALRVIVGFQQERGHATDDHRFAHSLGAVLPEIARDFAATHRESYQAEILKLQFRDQLVKVFCKRVIVVALGRLTG